MPVRMPPAACCPSANSRNHTGVARVACAAANNCVPGAALTIKDTGANVTVKAQTQTNGTYTFPSLTFGTYDLTVAKDGFETQVFTGVQVQTGRATTVSTPSPLSR